MRAQVSSKGIRRAAKPTHTGAVRFFAAKSCKPHAPQCDENAEHVLLAVAVKPQLFAVRSLVSQALHEEEDVGQHEAKICDDVSLLDAQLVRGAGKPAGAPSARRG
jgi:hypothetical protein